jgi:hypothetical protein
LDYILYDQKRSIEIAIELSDIFTKSNVSPQELTQVKKFLRDNQYHKLVMYHGTSAKNNIEDQGLLPTSMKRRHSLQSTLGYVYLSLYPTNAKNFGELAYPGNPIVVYRVEVPVQLLQADKDQLCNQRQYACRDVGNSLAESLIYGHGARVKGSIPQYMIRRYI